MERKSPVPFWPEFFQGRKWEFSKQSSEGEAESRLPFPPASGAWSYSETWVDLRHIYHLQRHTTTFTMNSVHEERTRCAHHLVPFKFNQTTAVNSHTLKSNKIDNSASKDLQVHTNPSKSLCLFERHPRMLVWYKERTENIHFFINLCK